MTCRLDPNLGRCDSFNLSIEEYLGYIQAGHPTAGSFSSPVTAASGQTWELGILGLRCGDGSQT